MKILTQDQIRANERIDAWMKGTPYQEYPGQRRPRVPQLTVPFVLNTYTPPNPEWSEQFFTHLAAGYEALKDVHIPQGATVFDPCAGIGHLLYAAQKTRLHQSGRWIAYEIEQRAFEIGCKLFPGVEWHNKNVFEDADELANMADVFICNPPFGGGSQLKPVNLDQWHTTKTEYLFLELAGKALKPGGQAIFIALDGLADDIPGPLADYLTSIGVQYSHSSPTPLPGDFLQTGVRVYAHYFITQY